MLTVKDTYKDKYRYLADTFGDGEPTPYWAMLEDVFKGDPYIPRYIPRTDELDFTRLSTLTTFDEFIMQEVYISYCTYFKDTSINTKLIKDVYALVVDVDGKKSSRREDRLLTRSELRNLLYLAKKKGITPTYIVHSGKGVHFVYVFKKPVPYLKCNRPLLHEINRRLQKELRGERHYVGHMYRMPGSLTKFNEPTYAFEAGYRYDPVILARKLLINPEEKKYQGFIPDRSIFEKMIKTEKKIGIKPKKKSGIKTRHKPFKHKKQRQNPAFYAFLKNLIKAKGNIEVGIRNNTVFALSVSAIKSGIDRSLLEQDIKNEILPLMSSPLTSREIQNALYGYNQKYVTMRWETLKAYLNVTDEDCKKAKIWKKDRKKQSTEPILPGLRNRSFLKYLGAIAYIQYRQIEKPTQAAINRHCGLDRKTVRKIENMLRKIKDALEKESPATPAFNPLVINAVRYICKTRADQRPSLYPQSHPPPGCVVG